MTIYNAHMRLLPFLSFSMKLGVINSFLIVCFTMVLKKIFKSENIYKIHAKILCNGYKTTFTENALHLQSIQERILPIIFPVILIN